MSAYPFTPPKPYAELEAERDRLRSRNAELEEGLELALAVMKKMKAMQALNAELLEALKAVRQAFPGLDGDKGFLPGIIKAAITKSEASNG